MDTVNFDKDSVTLQDVALAEMRMPIFREEPLALVRELYEQEQEVMEHPLPDYKVGDNVIVDLPTRTIEGTIGYVGETDVRIDTSAQGQSWDNEVINKRQFEDGLRQNEQVTTQPDDTVKTVAIYPAEENRMPYDIVIQTIGSKSPTLDAVEPERSTLELAGNFHITDDDLGVGGPKQKFARNIEAIRTLFKLEEEHRGATAEEQQVLSQYVGWGGLADAFDPNKENWSAEYTHLKELLSEDEYAAARASTLNAHYTSPTVIRGIYDAVERMGFRSGNILEPSMGVGNFFGMLPDTMQDSRLYGVELDSITGRIAKKLYPQADITVAGLRPQTAVISTIWRWATCLRQLQGQRQGVQQVGIQHPQLLFRQGHRPSASGRRGGVRHQPLHHGQQGQHRPQAHGRACRSAGCHPSAE